MGYFDGCVLASDFDKTLIGANSRISLANKEALQHFVAEGGLFVGATGRTEVSIRPYLEGLPFNAPWILYNGAALYDFRSESFVMRARLNEALCKAFIPQVLAHFPEVNVQVYTGGPFFEVNPCNPPEPEVIREQQPYNVSPLECVFGQWIKCVICSSSPEILRAVERMYEESPLAGQTDKTYSGSRYLEIAPLGATKGTALRSLLQHLPTQPTTIIAIGDYLNDISMLKEADIAASPENALPEVRCHANMVVASYNQNAIADLLMRVRQLL